MNLTDAELQQLTGFPIAKGSISVGTSADMTALGIGAHYHLLLSAEDRHRPPFLVIRPVSNVERDEYGFCQTTLADRGLSLSYLSLAHIGNITWVGGPRGSFARGGAQAGLLVKYKPGATPWIPESYVRIHSYELTAEYDAEGLQIAIAGQLAETAEAPAKEFSVRATVPWATMIIKGFRGAGAHWKFGRQSLPIKSDSPDRQRDPKRLQDLIIAEGLSWPYFKGKLSFTPELSLRAPPPTSVNSFLYVDLGEGLTPFHCSDAPRVELLDSGFARSGGQTRYLGFTMLDREKLELALRRRDEVSLTMAGDALGSVQYETGYRWEPSDQLGRIGQQVKTLSFSAILGSDGLRISAEGELHDFDPAEFARHKAERNSQLKPLRSYALGAIVPWAFLVCRNFSFADRMKDF
jgi:hypothetical protein